MHSISSSAFSFPKVPDSVYSSVHKLCEKNKKEAEMWDWLIDNILVFLTIYHFSSEQEFSELFGLVPHRAHEESDPNQHIDVDTDKVKINVKRSANAVQN